MSFSTSRPAANRRRFLALLPLALVVALAPSCSSMKREPSPTWLDVEVEAVSRDVLWQMAQLAIKRRGFPRGTDVDVNSLRMESGWRNSLAPFRGDGRRHKAVIQLSHIEGDTWKAEIRVKSQANMSIVRPTDPRYAEWEWRDDDQDEALILVQVLRSSLTTGDEYPERVLTPPDPER
jgi:hypothetical protein